MSTNLVYVEHGGDSSRATVTTPGVYVLDVEDYHLDPAPQPSLSSSGIKAILNESPLKFMAKHPRLTLWPNYEWPSTREQDLGSVLHSMLLAAGKPVLIVEGFDDWKKKAAQEQRKEAKANGFLPVLRKLFDEASEIVNCATAALVAEFGSWPIGQSEQTMVWRRRTNDHGEIWCRALADHLVRDRGLIVDLKTTGLPISDREVETRFAGQGYDIQAAHYLDGLVTLFPEFAGRERFVFATIEVTPPYDVRFDELPRSWLTIVGQRVDAASDKFAECLQSGQWPRRRKSELRMPPWHEQRMLEAEIANSRGVWV